MRPIQIVLTLLGLVLCGLALNTALGGMMTLGWQFSPLPLDQSDPLTAMRHDNNARFFAGAFAGMGLLLAVSAWRLESMRLVAVSILACMTLGGLARLTQGGYSPLTDTALLPSVLFELVGFPLIAFWTWRAK